MKKVFSVEEYIETKAHWQKELDLLRRIVLKTELNESIKWSAPVYDINGKNVLGLSAFKAHFCIWFFNGVFLKDEHGLLINAQEGKTKALRQMRFESIKDIDKNVVREYVKEAIENQKVGKEIKPQKTSKNVDIPAELKTLLRANNDLKVAFNRLSPSKQREYCQYISTAKREVTKLSRLEKITPLILKGTGIHDKYKNC